MPLNLAKLCLNSMSEFSSDFSSLGSVYLVSLAKNHPTVKPPIAEVRYQGTASLRTAHKQVSERYDTLKSLPHWLTQCASSAIMQVIFFFFLRSFQMGMNHESIASSGDMTMV